MKNKILRCLALAAMVCTMTVAYAQGDYDKYDKDNETYGTTPFINLSDMPRLYDCIPAHPAFESPEFSYDMLRYLWGKQQRLDEKRLNVAIEDAEWDDLEKVYACWKDAFGLEVTKEGTPAIYALLNKSLRTTDPTRRDVKEKYFRIRPFRYFGEETASGEDEELYNEGSYPSGHCLRGWTITLLMIQIAPERAAEIYKRGMDFGESRVIVGAHWQTDVDNSRMAGSMLFSVLQDNEDFQTMMKQARQEYDEKTAGNVKVAANTAQARETTARIYSIDGTSATEQTRGIVIRDSKKAVVK